MNLAVVGVVFRKFFRLLTPYIGAIISSMFRSRLGKGDSLTPLPALAGTPEWPKLMLVHDGDYGLGGIENASLYWVDASFCTVSDAILLTSLLDEEKLRLRRPPVRVS